MEDMRTSQYGLPLCDAQKGRTSNDWERVNHEKRHTEKIQRRWKLGNMATTCIKCEPVDQEAKLQNRPGERPWDEDRIVVRELDAIPEI